MFIAKLAKKYHVQSIFGYLNLPEGKQWTEQTPETTQLSNSIANTALGGCDQVTLQLLLRL